MRFLLVLVLLASCSRTKKDTVEKQPVRFSEQDIQACQDYQRNVLDSAYKQEKGPRGEELIFTADVGQARKALSQFDLNKGLASTKTQLVENILRDCNEKNLETFNDKYKSLARCSLMFSELYFFQSLIQGIKRYAWPIDLKLEAKKLSLDYVTHFSQGNFPLLNRLIALSVLDELSVHEVVNKQLHPEIKLLMEESQNHVEGLRLKLNKETSTTCKSLDIIRDELKYSKQVGDKMKEFLKRI